MILSRRELLAGATAFTLSASQVVAEDKSQPAIAKAQSRSNRIGISTYSFWQFEHEEYRGSDEPVPHGERNKKLHHGALPQLFGGV